MDTALDAIVEAAERGEALPVMRIAAGNTLFIGTPGSPDRFQEKAEWAVGEDYYNAHRPSKKTMDAVYQQATTYASSVMAPVARSLREVAGQVEALTLIDCQVWPTFGGDGVQVPFVRIPLDSIDGWWAGNGKRLKGSGATWFFGAIIPLDGGE